MTDIVLALCTTVFGGTSLWQFFLLRQERKKANAEASSAETDSERKKYELSKDQADYLIESLDKVNREYVELQQSIRDSESKHTQEILDKCKTISELRSQVVYHKEFRCFKMDCAERQKKRTTDDTLNESKSDTNRENQGV